MERILRYLCILPALISCGHESARRLAVNTDSLVQAIVQEARPGDHVVCMSNGSFGGIHDKLLAALGAASSAR